jgi:hypothetical protein
MGNLSHSTTSTAVLGLTQKFIKHDIPCGIAALEKTRFEYLGSTESILLYHTIFPLFVPFQNQVKIQEAIITIKGSRIDSLKYRLGLISSGFGAEHPLKACRYCMREDINAHGVAYWHLTHQYPGVLICHRHQAWLMTSTKSRRWSGRFEWSLPDEDYLIEQDSSRALWSPPAFLTMATNVIDLASIGRTSVFDPCIVAATYRTALFQGERPDSLLDRIKPLRCSHLFESLPTDEESTKSFINQLIRTPRRSIHPLKHLVLINWLFEGLHSFVEAYKTEVSRSAQQVASAPSRKLPERSSLSSAGVSTQKTARPKRLKGRIKDDLLTKLAKGVSKQKLCEEFRITVSTINKLLRANPTTYAQALQAKHGGEIDEHRGEWQHLHRVYPKLGVKALRTKRPSLYAWLYRNDKAWLMAEAQTFTKPVRRNSHTIDWEARDYRLLSMIETACWSISKLREEPVTKSELYAIVPMLSSCLENRQRYAMSRAYLSMVLGNSRSTVSAP